jgi:hypothetical protein
MYINKNLQDYFPADLTIAGIQDLYTSVGKYSYRVNSCCVISKGKLLSKQKRYIIFEVPTKSNIKMTEIVLIDLFLYKGMIYLVCENIATRRVFKVSFPLECPENECALLVVDINYFRDRMDDRAIKDYCGCGTDKKKPVGKGKTKAADDLLEFDF